MNGNQGSVATEQQGMVFETGCRRVYGVVSFLRRANINTAV